MDEWLSTPMSAMTIDDIVGLIILAGLIYLIARWMSS